MQHSAPAEPARGGRRPSAFVVRDLAPQDVGKPIDWSAWYLTDEDDMGEGCEQGDIIRLVLSSLGELLGPTFSAQPHRRTGARNDRR